MNTKLNKSDWFILIIIFGITTIFNAIDYYREKNELIEYLVDFPSNIILAILAILVFIQVLVPKYLVSKKNYFAFIIYGALILLVIGTIENSIGRLTAGKTLSSISNIAAYLQIGLYNGTDMIGFPLGIVLIKKFYESQTQITKIEKQQKENELKLLRSQLDPHFLFNNLNTLDSLIDSNPTKAKEYINRLSLIYRYLIQTKDAEVMELSEELDLVKNYIFLIKTRFGNDYEFEIEENININHKFTPTGALQTLLENVVKHNKSDGTDPIKTTIKINKNWIIVTNTKSNFIVKNESFGTGLENLKTRYLFLTDEKIQIHNMAKKFEIFIPIIKLQGA